VSETNCDSCDCRLLQPWGFHGLELCGPCCTGESDTVDTLTYDCVNRCKVKGTDSTEREIDRGDPVCCPFCKGPVTLTGKAVRPE
jgi:hypothetical protein